MLQLDGVRIGSDDLERARSAYTCLLGVEPEPLPGGGYRFQLGRGSVEVVAGAGGMQALRFIDPAPAPSTALFHGIRVLIQPSTGEHGDVRGAPQAATAGSPGAVVAIDHVVVRTTDPERAIALWRDRHGLRLALDREFAARGLRLQFFRSAGMTLEYASPIPAPPQASGDDVLHGVSYRIADLALWRARLVAAGVDVSEARPGMKPGTLVASVRSGTEGVPTLLLQAAGSEDRP